MKKIILLTLFVALCGCTQNNDYNISGEGRTIYASIDTSASINRVYAENYKHIYWHEGDEISFFDANTYNSKYSFAGSTGEKGGEFNAVATGTSSALSTTYGVYPYNAQTAINNDETISVELPATQLYAEDSFGKGATTLVAVGKNASDGRIYFKNACGYLLIKLYNPNGETVKRITLKGNAGEKIAGAANITASYGGTPSVAMAEDATGSVTIDCGKGITIGTTAESATEFWFALPETTFTSGITITAINTSGATYKKATSNPVVITRTDMLPMKALKAEFELSQPDTNEIWYTNGSTTSPSIPYSSAALGATIQSNSYDADKECWVIKFDKNITTVGDNAFYYNTNVTSIILPEGVTSIGKYAFYFCTKLTSVTIPKSVTSIGAYAFYCCYALSSVYCKPTTPPSAGNGFVFYNNASTRKIYVPEASVDAYKNAYNWTNYTNYIEGYKFE
ncbi:MAG: leucine-rich repeat domain-containing protein [Tidjanibacter sp.]|nr:leucine-rich repeat domain-containing protein [Tidjanibacter sp.]